ncbi:MAG: hypothetical protein AAF203_01415, partial [Pseudomonadota bacterium]
MTQLNFVFFLFVTLVFSINAWGLPHPTVPTSYTTENLCPYPECFIDGTKVRLKIQISCDEQVA